MSPLSNHPLLDPPEPEPPKNAAKLAWQCGECLDVHDDEVDAQECCPPDIREGFTCSVCEDFHREEKDAQECCPAPDPTAPPKAAELEALGQCPLLSVGTQH